MRRYGHKTQPYRGIEEGVEMIKPAMNIVFASDNNYVKYTAVTLASLLKNLTKDRPISVFILTDEPISQDNMAKLHDLQRLHPFALVNHVVDAEGFSRIRTTPGITIATYYRLVMHRILPNEISRALYLDSDLIIRKCVGDLYDTDLKGKVFAGVEDSRSIDYNRKFGTPEDAPHINAGVTLVDLDAMRSIEFTGRVNSYLDKHRYTITLGDQQILNAEFYPEIMYVPVEWNVHGSMFDRGWCRKAAGILNGFTADELIQAASNPAITHYTYKRKPWISMEHPRAKEWVEYAKLTQFFDSKILPSSTPVTATTKPLSPIKKTPLIDRVDGYLKSIIELRQARLAVNHVAREVGMVLKSIHGKLDKPPVTPYYLLQEQSSRLLSEISRRPLHSDFVARQYVENLPEFSRIFTNGEPRDLDGGFHENIKSIFRTPEISRGLDVSEVDASIILVQRLRQESFWNALYYAKSYGKDVVFAETGFFGAFASYYDNAAPIQLRKCFGYILDDMGYYFDARNPSRLEAVLNSERAKLAREEEQRARKLIDRIVSEGFTKYNFSSKPLAAFSLPSDSILIIDQKQGDASIEFAAATPRTFERMIEAAVKENPGAPIFLKAHPDNLGKSGYNLDSRVHLVPENASITHLLDRCAKVYVVSSQVGFEGILRGKEVHVFGLPFYAGWGLTNDRQKLPRRTAKRTVEELFHAACIRQSVYIHPFRNKLIDIEDAFDFIAEMRQRHRAALAKDGGERAAAE